MPKGSEERTNARKEEIIDACAGLYETMSFKEITIREIGKQTSFTRTSIYNYFQAKEEIFLAHTLEKRERLLKLLAMNHYDMEANSRMENLVAFKTAYGNSLSALSRCLEKFFPQMQEKDIEGFLYAFFPFLFGVYPYTSVTEKQTEAMDRAGVRYVCYSVREIVCSMTKKLLERYRQSAPVVL